MSWAVVLVGLDDSAAASSFDGGCGHSLKAPNDERSVLHGPGEFVMG